MSTDRIIHLDDIRDIPTPEDVPEPVTSSWTPNNLLQLAANPPEPPTIGGLLYPAKRSVLSGETESMKTWLALILCKAELDINHPVIWVDLDAMGPGAMLERLRLLGTTDEQIQDGFLYIEPDQPLTPTLTQQLADTIANTNSRLCVIDAFNPILTLHGLEPNNVNDIETFWTTIANPITKAGAACVLLDHVVKNAEARGKYSSGSERKASGANGAHIGFKLLQPLTKGSQGKTLLTVHKDRPGYLPRPVIGRLILTSTGDEITYTIEPDKSHDPDTGAFRPTILMEKVSRRLEFHTEPLSKNQIEEGLGKAEYVRKAIAQLKDDGYLTENKGPRGALLYTLIRPFRQADQPTTPTSSPPRPHLVPNLRSTNASTSSLLPSPPLGGEVGTRWSGRPRDELAPPRPLEPGDPIPEYDFPPIDETLAPELDEEPF